MKKIISSLVALAIVLAVFVPVKPPVCCDEHAGTNQSCVSTFNIFPTSDNY